MLSCAGGNLGAEEKWRGEKRGSEQARVNRLKGSGLSCAGCTAAYGMD